MSAPRAFLGAVVLLFGAGDLGAQEATKVDANQASWKTTCPPIGTTIAEKCVRSSDSKTYQIVGEKRNWTDSNQTESVYAARRTVLVAKSEKVQRFRTVVDEWVTKFKSGNGSFDLPMAKPGMTVLFERQGNGWTMIDEKSPLDDDMSALFLQEEIRDGEPGSSVDAFLRALAGKSFKLDEDTPLDVAAARAIVALDAAKEPTIKESSITLTELSGSGEAKRAEFDYALKLDGTLAPGIDVAADLSGSFAVELATGRVHSYTRRGTLTNRRKVKVKDQEVLEETVSKEMLSITRIYGKTVIEDSK